MDRLTKERLKIRYLAVRPWTRHSLVLLVAGLTYIGIGYAYLTSVAVSPEREVALEVILNVMTFQQWGVVFVLVGCFVLVASRWPPASEKWGYSLLTGLATAWASGYVLSILFASSPISNISGAFVWGLVAFLWWAISGLNSPPRVVINGRS